MVQKDTPKEPKKKIQLGFKINFKLLESVTGTAPFFECIGAKRHPQGTKEKHTTWL
jgi:hypothetical protein